MSQTYFDFLEAFKQKSCPICLLIKKSIHKLMDSFLYESVNDYKIREEINKSLGYCSLHSWQLQKFMDGLGLSIIYENLLDVLVGKIKRSTNHKKNNTQYLLLRELLGDKTRKSYTENTKVTCPTCRHQKDIERIYITSFIEYFNNSTFKENFRTSFGLCLPHFIATIKLCDDKTVAEELSKIEVEQLESLKQELIEFQRKNDYRFSDEGFGEERDSWIRAVKKMVGEEGIF